MYLFHYVRNNYQIKEFGRYIKYLLVFTVRLPLSTVSLKTAKYITVVV